MTDQPNIVTRLRAVLHNDRSVELMNREAADEIERLRAERDEARREVCAYVSGHYRKDVVTLDRVATLEEAKRRGWDCFKGETP
jgi:hypothetical protein